jgi:hypothetical protein
MFRSDISNAFSNKLIQHPVANGLDQVRLREFHRRAPQVDLAVAHIGAPPAPGADAARGVEAWRKRPNWNMSGWPVEPPVL